MLDLVRRHPRPATATTIIVVALFAMQPSAARSASSSVTVSMTVASATSLDASGCGDGRSYREHVLADGAAGYWRLEESGAGDPVGRIAFTSDRDGDPEIYTMARDGSGIVQLTSNTVADSAPAWSPDGKRIAFYSERDGNGEVYVMNADGSAQTRLTTDAAMDLEPSWSPGGDRIGFRSLRDGNSELYHMAADGTDVVRITTDPASDAHMHWAPGNTGVVFVSDRDGNWEVYTSAPDGSSPVRRTTTAASEFWPKYSPDGGRIAYYSAATGGGDVYVMNSDGTGQTRLTTNGALDNFPSWSRDGARLAFETDRNGSNDVYTMRTDGTDEQRLTTDAATDGQAHWQAAATAVDATAARRDGIYEGPVTFGQDGGLPSMTSRAVRFAGYGSYSRVALTGLPTSGAAGATTTVEFWMKWDGSDNVMPFGFDRYDLWLYSGGFGFNTGNSDLYGVSSAGLAGRWVHVVATFTNGDVTKNRLLVDGVEQTLTQRNGIPVARTTTAVAWISGFGYGPWHFGGTLDEVAVYPGSLPDGIARAHYQIGTSPAGAGTDFGVTLPGSPRVTSADCTLRFGSSNDTAMLRAYQLDGGGDAMRPAPSSGVVADWPFNGSTRDVSTTANDAVLAGGTSYATGPSGAGDALALDGTGYGRAPWKAAYDLQSFTVDLWFKSTNLANVSTPRLVEKGNGSGTSRNFVLAFASSGTTLTGGVSAGGVDTQVNASAAGLDDGQWHHVALVVEPGRMLLYVDGALAGSTSFSGSVDTPANDITIGESGALTGQRLLGSIDQVRLHAVARTSAEIRSYASGRISDYQGGVADWSSGSSTSTFGACLRSVADGASAVWTTDAACTASDGAHWRGIPSNASAADAKVASSATGMQEATAHLRFGLRPSSSQPTGSYLAPVTFEVLAPNA